MANTPRRNNNSSQKSGSNFKDKPNQGGPSKNSNRKRRNYKSKNNQKRLPREEYLRQRYQNLLETYLAARKKHYETNYKADPRQKIKLEKSWQTALKQLRDFESGLEKSETDMKLFNSVLQESRLKEDLGYSTIHGLAPVEEIDEENLDINDPHFLIKQVEADFQSDSEESTGSMDDYLAYKGAV